MENIIRFLSRFVKKIFLTFTRARDTIYNIYRSVFMYLKLRILFTILSAICLAVLLPAIAMGGWLYLVICGGLALIFFLAMLICKQKQEEAEPLSKEEGESDFFRPDSKDGEEK